MTPPQSSHYRPGIGLGIHRHPSSSRIRLVRPPAAEMVGIIDRHPIQPPTGGQQYVPDHIHRRKLLSPGVEGERVAVVNLVVGKAMQSGHVLGRDRFPEVGMVEAGQTTILDHAIDHGLKNLYHRCARRGSERVSGADPAEM